MSMTGKYIFSMPEILKTTASSDMCDVELCRIISKTQDDHQTRLVEITYRLWTHEHIVKRVLPRWSNVWHPRGIKLSLHDHRTLLIEYVGESD